LLLSFTLWPPSPTFLAARHVTLNSCINSKSRDYKCDHEKQGTIGSSETIQHEDDTDENDDYAANYFHRRIGLLCRSTTSDWDAVVLNVSFSLRLIVPHRPQWVGRISQIREWVRFGGVRLRRVKSVERIG